MYSHICVYIYIYTHLSLSIYIYRLHSYVNVQQKTLKDGEAAPASAYKRLRKSKADTTNQVVRGKRGRDTETRDGWRETLPHIILIIILMVMMITTTITNDC